MTVPRIAYHWSEIEQAIRIAFDAHLGQIDKCGEPYFWHALRVGVSLLPDTDAALVGILHDVLEDGRWKDRSRARMLVGHENPRRQALEYLARPEERSYEEYVFLIATLDGRAGEIARKVKLADLRDNLTPDRLSRLPPEESKRLRTRYQAAFSLIELHSS